MFPLSSQSFMGIFIGALSVSIMRGNIPKGHLFGGCRLAPTIRIIAVWGV